jgi:hypothetical protein
MGQVTGCERSFLNDTGVQVGVRQTRQMKPLGMLTNGHVVSKAKTKTGQVDQRNSR